MEEARIRIPGQYEECPTISANAAIGRVRSIRVVKMSAGDMFGLARHSTADDQQGKAFGYRAEVEKWLQQG